MAWRGVVAVAVLAIACQATPQGPTSSSSPSASATRARSRARLTISPRDHAKAADPSGGIEVAVAHGTLTSVTATAGDERVAG